MTRSIAVGWAAAAVALTLTGAAFAQPPHVLVPADKVTWGPAPPALPAGAQISVLEGDPGKKGAITLRLQFPANYTVPPHWHSMTERVTVLSGTLQVGMGDTLRSSGEQKRCGRAGSCRCPRRCATTRGRRPRPSFKSIWKDRSTSMT
jgi:hypothetical protein